ALVKTWTSFVKAFSRLSTQARWNVHDAPFCRVINFLPSTGAFSPRSEASNPATRSRHHPPRDLPKEGCRRAVSHRESPRRNLSNQESTAWSGRLTKGWIFRRLDRNFEVCLKRV